MNEETITIKKTEYDRLTHDSKFLAGLHARGVDNWEGYFGDDEDDEDEDEEY